MKKEDRKRALEFMEAHLGLCRASRCSIETYGLVDGVEVYAWIPVDDADAFFANDHKILTRRIEADE